MQRLNAKDALAEAFAKSTAILEAAPMPEAKRMPRLLREIAEAVLDIPLDFGRWLQVFLPWEVPDGLYTTIAPNFFAIVHDLASRYICRARPLTPRPYHRIYKNTD